MMQKRILSVVLCFIMVLGLLPTAAFAAGPSAVYVSNTGDDGKAGTADAPYATLAKAVEAAADGSTIYVMSDLTMTKCARFYNKSLTITSSDGGPYTITRGDSFDQQQDTARSTYNPAMIEVQANSGTGAGLTLTNIILDDADKHQGEVFAQAVSKGGEDDAAAAEVDNTVYVQDAMIASNATVASTITLGNGAVLRNFGGMSAVRITDKAKLVMESGSVIEDTESHTTLRTKGTATNEVGPAGAVWIQGASFEMKAGAKIQNVDGRAVYVDGGSATIGGTISGIKANGNMWQSKDGVALHLRGNAEGKLTSGASVTGCTGTLVAVIGSTFTMENGAGITGNSNGNVISSTGSSVTINGEIANNNTGGQHVLQTADNTKTTIGSTGNIHHNEVFYGTVYLNGNNEELHIYGKINNNESTDRGGGVVLSNNGNKNKTATMYPGAEINGNSAKETGGGMMVSCGIFTMKGGTISNNTAGDEGGGVYVRRGGQFIMEGGTISNNHSNKYGGGIAYEASSYNGGVPYVSLKNGTITGNTMGDPASKVSNDLGISGSEYSYINRYFFISDDVTIGNKAVYFEKDSKTITPADDSFDIKLGNASSSAITKLTNDSKSKGWGEPLATFWAQRDGAATLTVGGLTLNAALPVYVLVLPVKSGGTPVERTNARCYAAAKTTDGVQFTIPAGDLADPGCAIAIVQPTADYGTLALTGPASIQQDKTVKSYPVYYTATYTMSKNLENIIEASEKDPSYNLVPNFGVGLNSTPYNNSSFDGSSYTWNCTLPQDKFEANKSLCTFAMLTVTVGDGSYVIPSNVVETKMLPLEHTVTFDLNGGSGSGSIDPVTVNDDAALGDKMPADPSRSGYTFAGWNTQSDGKGTAFTGSTPVTASLIVYAQWTANHSGGDGGGSSSTTYYYFAIEKTDAEDGHALSGAEFGLFLDGKQIASAVSNKNGSAIFRVGENSYNRIGKDSELYYQELTAPDGYALSSVKSVIGKSDLYRDRSTAVKHAASVRNYAKNVPADLNGNDHVAYVHGYADGTVKPNNKITRAETATMLYRLLTESRRNEIRTVNNAFSDVPADIWYNEAVSSMANGNYIVGYPDGTFGGGNHITRAAFVAMLVRFIGVRDETCSFTDVPTDHWAYSYIATATSAGWIAGYTDGSFKPQQTITRAEVMTIINRVLNRGVNAESELLSFKVFPDNAPTAWYYYDVIEASNDHEYTGSRPSENWTSLRNS